ncbi:uncharacterized protein [Spinacia oleracea]|uniref:Uncharacterized protein isoform X3 n=1 Tax=Spinacia oleracea TaxID=3562 RepID=A0ABM3RG86_SPIOL|nr:uncharacterized protein LOC110781324 isoform X3 [Spinacia oleracea]
MGKRNAPLPKEKKTEEDVVKGKGVSTRAGARTRTTACGLKAVEGSSSGKKRKVYDAEISGEEEPRTESNDDEDVVSIHNLTTTIRPMLSVGAQVKKSETVVSTRLRKGMHENDRIEVFSKLVSLLDDSRRDLVRKMGFGALLTVKLRNLSPEFAYWLVTRVDGANGVFYGGGDMEFSLDPIQFNCVLGLPMGTQPVPSLNGNLDTRHRNIADHIVQMYGDSGGVSVQKAWEFAVGMRDGQGKAVATIVPIVTREEEFEFRIAFMIVILELVLCPSTDGFTLAGRLLPAASVAPESNSYDWCTFCLEWLKIWCKMFAHQFDQHGVVSGLGGCSLFLTVFYLDHLNVVPRQWCVMPRVDVWSQSDVDALIEADKKAGGDYGRTQSVDVAYGERHHPRLPRDMRGSYIAKEVLNVLTSRFERIEEQMHNQGEVLRSMKLDLSRIVGVREQDSGLKDTQSGGTSGGSVGGVAVCPALGGTQTMRPTTIPTATAQQFGVPSPVGFAPAFGSARGIGTRGFGFPPPSTSVSPVLTEVQSPAQKPVITTEILKGVSPLRSSRKSRTDMEKELVAFIKECQGNSKDEGPELIEFDGLCLSKYQMYRMVAMDEYAGIEYVKVASKMYTSRWKAELGAGRGRSVMLEPGFGVKVQTNEPPQSLVAPFGAPFENLVIRKMFVVVVPVLHMYFTLPPHTRWYCVALSMKDKRIWVLDPTSDEPLSEHGRLISHMFKYLDTLFYFKDESWVKDGLSGWGVDLVSVPPSDDVSSCVVMLAWIKDIVQRNKISPTFQPGAIEDARVSLAVDDILCELNVRRPEVYDLISGRQVRV